MDSWEGSVRTDEREDIYYKAAVTPAIKAAEGSRLGRVYMDWSSWPLVTEQSPIGDPAFATYRPVTPVIFHDMRFGYGGFGGLMGTAMRGAFRSRAEAGHSPLDAEVLVGPDGSVVEMRMGSRVQR